MKHKAVWFKYVLLLFLFSACRSDRLDDGIYTEDTSKTSPLQIQVPDPQGKLHKLHLKTFKRVRVEAVYKQPLPVDEDCYFIQINLQSSDDRWYEEPILLLINK